MCCRYILDRPERELEEIVERAAKSPLTERFEARQAGSLVQSGEVRPMSVAPAIATARGGGQAVFPMRWGFTLAGKPSPLINARAETAAEKQTFRDAWNSHRCILPASRYFEWQHLPSADGKTAAAVKYAIRPCDSELAWLCGLYRIENGLPVFVVLTTEPSPDVAFLHDRMPLILPKGCVRAWIDPAVRAEELLPYALTRLSAEKVG